MLTFVNMMDKKDMPRWKCTQVQACTQAVFEEMNVHVRLSYCNPSSSQNERKKERVE